MYNSCYCIVDWVLVSTCVVYSGWNNCHHLHSWTSCDVYKSKPDNLLTVSWCCYYHLQFFYAIASSKSSNIIVLCLAEIMVSKRFSSLLQSIVSKTEFVLHGKHWLITSCIFGTCPGLLMIKIENCYPYYCTCHGFNRLIPLSNDKTCWVLHWHCQQQQTNWL